MSELPNKLNKVLSDLEKNIKNKEDLDYAKGQICNMYNIFIEEFEDLEARNNEKIDSILIRYKAIENRMNEVEQEIEQIENDIYMKDNEEYEFNITCPYCNIEFEVDCTEGAKHTVTCPECNNTIELDWNEHEGCSHDCCDCDEECNHHNDEDDDM